MKRKLFLVSMALLAIVFCGRSQFKLSDYAYDWDSTGYIYFHPKLLKPGEPFKIYKNITGDSLHDLVLIRKDHSPNSNIWYHHFQETYRGLKVEGAEYNEHALNGFLVSANGKITQFDPDVRAEPVLSMEEARDILLHQFNRFNVFAWEDKDYENELKSNTGNPDTSYFPSGELLWAVDITEDFQWFIPYEKFLLAYRFDVLCISPYFHKAFYVDARTGKVFRKDELIRDRQGSNNPVIRQAGINHNFVKGPVIYPNPAREVINIEFEEEGSFTLQLFSANGRVLHIVQMKNSREEKIDISALPKGMYFLRVKQSGFLSSIVKQ